MHQDGQRCPAREVWLVTLTSLIGRSAFDDLEVVIPFHEPFVLQILQPRNTRVLSFFAVDPMGMPTPRPHVGQEMECENRGVRPEDPGSWHLPKEATIRDNRYPN